MQPYYIRYYGDYPFLFFGYPNNKWAQEDFEWAVNNYLQELGKANEST